MPVANPDFAKTILLHQGRTGKWRATIEQGNTQTATFGETAEEAVSGLLRLQRGGH